ncbi:uncharacterized protein LOC131147763 [Malania oleifera]|uniref:uncharacterized protein LOC131147763 n=1 Tax=Malania oleifera TaxID=397392 RepID=UPI0025ADE1C3|nr:uncharacterized protein LOC131147763 [Malania oleifera]
MNPLEFSGGADPTVAENWMQEIEKILTVLHYTDEKRVLYTTYKLIGEAKRWWVATRLLEEQRPIPVVMTWSRFREVFFNRYFPATVKEAKYAAKFVELICFAPYIIPDEVKKAKMFERGLRREIYKQVAVLKLQDFSKLVDRAIVVEKSEQKDMGAPSQRKKPTPPGF